MLFGKLLVEAEEVAEAPPHGKGLVTEHLQRGLKHGTTEPKYPIIATANSHDTLNEPVLYLCCYFVGHVSVHPVP